MKNVTKRDGRIVPFDRSKIVNAIRSAMERTSRIDEALANYISERIAAIDHDCTVEEIQDIVEHYLMDSDRKDVAKEYIIYRAERSRIREMNSGIVKNVWDKISGKKIENANANVDEATFGGRKNEASSALQEALELDMNMSTDLMISFQSLSLDN